VSSAQVVAAPISSEAATLGNTTLQRRVIETYVAACGGAPGPARAFDAALQVYLETCGREIPPKEARLAVARILATCDGRSPEAMPIQQELAGA
jgi:hypothetical protein